MEKHSGCKEGIRTFRNGSNHGGVAVRLVSVTRGDKSEPLQQNTVVVVKRSEELLEMEAGRVVSVILDK